MWAVAVTAEALTATAQLALDLALAVALGDGLALVILALATGEGDLNLGAAFGQVHAQGHDGVALELDFFGHFADLSFVQQQPPWPQRVVVVARGRIIGGDVS